MGEVTSASTTLLPSLAAIPGHVFWRAAARVGHAAEAVLPPDLDLTAYAVLHALPPGATASQQAVADAVVVSRTTMTKVAADLLSAGLIERVRNPGDRRSYLLSRAPAAEPALAGWDADVAALDEVVLRPFDEVGRARLTELLTVLADDVLPDDLPDAVRGSVSLLLVRVHAWLYRQFQELLAPLGIEPRHVGALTALTTLGPVSQTDLARGIGLSAASVVAIVDELEERELVERRRVVGDRRTQEVHLTEFAPAVLRAARTRGRRGATTAFAALPDGGLEELLDLLRAIVTADPPVI
ncbi:MarR family transcriptional regulator [Nocardioides sp. CFH 31398]|uniref:MarR family transcriptional regulator n=1 Tax=Nocardioides sp. CFH 31398 TaxID=2919579 RepID=UPI001F054B59|nr:MarR family transcriptional regulator [Nocardioides sp. CFH 31398]MCH1864913.1 MarR family transcriptional regulator [Nocardioides sp. CFH 31398]